MVKKVKRVKMFKKGGHEGQEGQDLNLDLNLICISTIATIYEY